MLPVVAIVQQASRAGVIVADGEQRVHAVCALERVQRHVLAHRARQVDGHPKGAPRPLRPRRLERQLVALEQLEQHFDEPAHEHVPVAEHPAVNGVVAQRSAGRKHHEVHNLRKLRRERGAGRRNGARAKDCDRKRPRNLVPARILQRREQDLRAARPAAQEVFGGAENRVKARAVWRKRNGLVRLRRIEPVGVSEPRALLDAVPRSFQVVLVLINGAAGGRHLPLCFVCCLADSWPQAATAPARWLH